ncbi:MAG: ABC transporter permease [Sedimentibacter sp.]|uniref:ABC transporter permease n=1 Tax=Sedimentibacter sp. TaxID=1960295 RepID=UPI0031582C68
MLEQVLTIGFVTALLSSAVRMALPLMYAGLGETILEKTGILNIGMEGVMLSGAFFSFLAASFAGGSLAGLLGGIAGGMLVSIIHGVLCIKLAKDQSVSGISLNLLFLGITSFLFKLIFGSKSYHQIATLPVVKIPLLSSIPVLGEAFFNQDVLAYIAYLLIIAAAVFYRKTGLGLSFSAVGENPKAAEQAGIPVNRYRYAAILLNGALGGIGGAHLVLAQLGVFNENMTSGRGYIALAAVILGRYSPVGMFGAALIFGIANALQIRLQALGVPLPPQALAMLPYVFTLAALLGSIGKSNDPDGLGKIYVRGAR